MGQTIGGRTIDEIYIFPYESTGGPTFNPAYAQKQWLDPNAIANSDINGNCTYTVLVMGANGAYLSNPQGLPYTIQLTLDCTRASELNLVGNYQGVAKPPMAFPLDLTKLKSGEQFGWSPVLPGIPIIVNTNPSTSETATVPFTQRQVEILEALNTKLELGL